MRLEAKKHGNSSGSLEQIIDNPMTAYASVIGAWLIAWWVQMNPLSFLNLAPGVELPFFPAGIRTLAVFIFGINGALAILIGSLISYAWLFPAVTFGNYVSVFAIAAVSSLSAYVAMRGYLYISKTPVDLSELSVRKITHIVLIQSFTSSSLHQLIYQTQHISQHYDQMSYLDNVILWLGMAAGDLVGSMIVMLGAGLILECYDALRRK